MKLSLRLLAFALGTCLAFAMPTAARAQVGYGVTGGLPAWGPPVPQGTHYYYIPEIDGYYDLYNGLYIVFDGQQWVALPYLNGYDPAYFHPVPVVSYAGPQPWLYINSYRQRCPQYVVGYRHGGWGRGGYGGRGYGHGRGGGYGAGNYYGRGSYGGYNNRSQGGGYDYGRGQRGGYGGRNQREGSQPGFNQAQPGGQPAYGQRQPGQPNFGNQPDDGQRGGDRDQPGDNPNWGGRRGR